ncbi:MAG: hypothetical protein RMI01_08975, partial [Thermodesulfovibrio sp.]|nr:hypothetical protein [Thermodesulfovibrio sp.]
MNFMSQQLQIFLCLPPRSSLRATYTLSEGTYYWRLRAKDLANNLSGWSSVWSVQVDTTPPIATTLSSPLDGLTTNYTEQTFNWTTVLDLGPGGLSHYKLELSTMPSFVPLWYSSSVVSNTLTYNLINSSTYYWRVFAVDRANNFSTISATFTIVIDTISPNVPTLIKPLNNMATNQTLIVFEYSSVDIGPAGIKDYTLEISTTSIFDVIWHSTITSSVFYSTTLPQNIYWWRVRTSDHAGNYSLWSSTRRFVVDVSSPQITTLVFPANDTRTNITSLTFQWNSVSDIGPAGVEHYELQISTDSNFGIINYSSVTLNIQATQSLLEGRYYWRVKTKDFAGNYSVSTSSEVTVDTTPPHIVDNQPGDDVWYQAATAVYNVDFFDRPSVNGAGLDYAEYIVYSSTNPDGTQAGQALTSWQKIFDLSLPSRTTYYTDNWDISPVWDSLQQGYNFV